MARQWQAQGYRVASLTLLDSEAPRSAEDPVITRTLAACMREYVESIGFNLDAELDIDSALYANGDVEQMLHVVHQHLQRLGKIPANASARLLKGPWQTFYAARQTHYIPTSHYPNPLYLIQVRDPWMTLEECLKRRDEDAAGWARWAEKLETLTGPAQHFTLLKTPHVSELVQRWLQFVL
jgi:thioesterase domain-containing protein